MNFFQHGLKRVIVACVLVTRYLFETAAFIWDLAIVKRVEIDDTKVMLFLIHSVHVVTRHITKNSCVLL